jgi:protease-4
MKASRFIVITTLLLAAISFAVLTLFVIVRIAAPSRADLMSPGSKVALVRITGPIETGDEIIEELDDYRKSDGVRAVVLRIDTPGGGVGASREIYDAVLRIREEGKPVVVSMGPIAASGGYYIACAGDSILAGPSTITGSIGVIAIFGSFKRALEKIGIDFNIVATGPFKASGSEFKEMTEEERAYIQDLLDDLFEQFVDVVAEGRGLSRDAVLAVADGRAFSGRQAVDLGLVDRFGTLEDATNVAAVLAGLPIPPRTIERRERRFSLRDLLREANLFVRLAPQSLPRIEYRLY